LWPELLQDLNLRLSSNTWVVSFTPESASTAAAEAPASGSPSPVGRGRFGRPSPQPQPEQGSEGGGPSANAARTIGELRIEGAGIHSSDNPELDIQSVEDFAKSLRESPFYDKTPSGVEIIIPPDPTSQKQIFTFTIRAKLLKSLPI
jgi:hypothetical protein